MRRFLMFLVVTLVAVAMGVTVYYFVFDDEYITISQAPRWMNVGDTITLEDLEFEHYKPTKDTVIDFNAGGETSTTVVEYDENSKSFIAKQGGNVTVVISSTHEKYPQFKIDFTVGDGTQDYPFFISTETDLNKIGNAIFGLNKNYQLLNDIYMTKPMVPIGFDKTNLSSGTELGFSGIFDGCGLSIFNLTVGSDALCNVTNAGLFSTINDIALVQNLNVVTGEMIGEYENMGAIAGICKGTIDKCTVTTNITNNKVSSTGDVSTGAVVGKLVTVGDSVAKLYRTNATGTVSASGCLGGLVGTVDQAWIRTCWTSVGSTLKTLNALTIRNIVGGMVGLYLCDVEKGMIMESYSLASVRTETGTGTGYGTATTGALVGYIDGNTYKGSIVGLYYSQENTTTSSMRAIGNIENYNAYAYATNSVQFYDGLKVGNTNALNFYQITTPNVSTVLWDTKTCWNFEQDKYPQIMLLDKAMPIPPDFTFDEEITYVQIDNHKVNMVANKTAAEELHDLLENNPDGNFAIVEDIMLGSESEYGLFTPVTEFRGRLIANAKTETSRYGLYNFKIDSPVDGNSNLGLFQVINGATLRNFEIHNAKIVNNAKRTYVGVICGRSAGTDRKMSTIDNIVVDNVKIETTTTNDSANQTVVGALAGYTFLTNVSNCKINKVEMTTLISSNQNTSTLHTAVNAFGGLIGRTISSTVSNCTVTGLKLEGINNVGGLIGWADTNTTLTNCSIVILSDGEDTIYSDIKGTYLKLPTTDITHTQNLNLGGAIGKLQAGSSIENVIIDSIAISGVGTALARSNILLGGIVGDNSGTVELSRLINDSSIMLTNSGGSATIYVGGVVGQNVAGGKISEKSYSNAIVNLNSENELVCTEGYYGGIVGKNSGVVELSYFCGNIGGKFVGGIAGINNGSIRRCYSGGDKITFEEDDITENNAYQTSLSRNIVKGLCVSGLVYEMTSGTVNDCFVACALQGIEEGKGNLYYDTKWVGGSQKSGLVNIFGGTADSYGIIKDCISVCSFDAVGNNYLESNSNFFAITTGGRQTGTLTNCILDKTAGNGAISRTEGSALLGWTGWIKCTSGSTWTALTTTQMTIELSKFDAFSGATWNIVEGRYPKLTGFDLI